MALVGAVAVLAAACSSGGATSSSSTATGHSASPTSSVSPTAGLPGIRHVFVIVLENKGYDATFASPSADPYLATTLPAAGALLTNYHGIGHLSNDNYIGLLSGQAPNPLNQADCQVFANFPATATVAGDGQISDSGCLFPTSVTTVANQLSQAHLTWKAYMQDMGNIPAREAPVCGHPAIGAPDATEKAVPGDGYATRHNPFVYFHSIIDDKGGCDRNVVPLGTTTGALPAGTPSGVTALATDLKSASATPNFTFITPNLCNDGHDAPCVNQPAASSALTNIDAFLHTWVPLITNSPAFKKDGLLEVTFDEADTGDATSCCNETPGPAAPSPGLTGPGGGRTGTVLLSPFIKGGTTTSVPYNHYSTLASVEDIFGLTKLGQAQTTSATFGKDIFTKSG
jgi:phosphatidylinositol-3-phosphatase